jgi:NADH-quinone oxidoreductase subunit A
MLSEYIGVLLMLGFALLLTVGMLLVHMGVGPRRVFEKKLEPFECGEEQIVSPRQRHAVKFYLVAILFVVFDVEAVFFYPWGATFQETGVPGLIAITVFTIPLVVGLIYEWSKGALEW